MSSYTAKLIIIAVIMVVLIALFLSWFDKTSSGLTQKIQKAKSVTNFEQCTASGYPVQESYPRICRVPGGKSFVEQITPSPTSASLVPPQESGPSGHVGACQNQCGNGECQQIVCTAVGCPCSENAQSCPHDCK